ncbi:MAG: pilus assembly protein TadG-related protein [Acidobacteriota bacterium]
MRSRQKGFVLIAMSVAMLLMLASLGMAFDFGRIYIARNEAQIFTDAAALAAAQKLDGTASGVDAAREAVRRLPNRWSLGTKSFEGVVVEFSADAKKWEANPADPAGLTFTRVTAPENQVSIVFLRAVGGPESFTVPAHSVAATAPTRLVE